MSPRSLRQPRSHGALSLYLLDTNHCSRILGGNPGVLRRIIEVSESQIATCLIVRGELLFMAHNSEQRERNLEQVRRFLKDIRVYFVDEETADTYGQLKAGIINHFGPKEKAKRRKTRLGELGISENDLWIASTALRHSLTVVSADQDFERIREVREFALECWLSPD